jgi:hypothetical protein
VLLPLPQPMKTPAVMTGLMVAATLLTLASATRYALRWRARRRELSSQCVHERFGQR